ncbi:transposase domain-containing protein [Paracoccus jiaweipingae]|uniref:transposase domain-containing protein n=1 Tax=Paracoccus sp. p2-l61 TaxID=3366950 RepID=UPI0037A4CB92
MTRHIPDIEWWTTDALAGSGLPDLPATRRGVDQLAARLGWREHPTLARKRAGRGGGWEYSWKLLPSAAQKALLREVTTAAVGRGRGETWAFFEALPDAAKDKARHRLAVVQQVQALEPPLGRHGAVQSVAETNSVSVRTIWNWLAMIEGVDAADWLAYLAPRHRATAAKEKKTGCSPEFFERLKSVYLQLEGPSFSGAYDVARKLARKNGWDYLTERTARRWFDEQVPRVTQVFARQGVAGLEKCFPPQQRDRTGMVAMEGVVADCHKIDVFVNWPGIDKPMRPQIVVFQDIYSGKVLSWRVDRDPNKVMVMSAFGELIEDWGIPKHCLFDNGREFASKWLTGGTKTRFRFKIREDDPLGVLPLLGIQVHWARPYHGQSKPVERAFRDWADRIAKDPRFHGAYVGHKPDAKPENYGSRAIELEYFLKVLAEGIAEHNARDGRASDTARGRSFDETFAESYAKAPILKATQEQRRLWLMGQVTAKLHQNHGAITIHKNRYWSDWMNEFAGQELVARFDPEDLHAGAYIYRPTGEFMGFAECKEKVGFFDVASARDTAAANARRKRAEKQFLEKTRSIPIRQIAAELDAAAPADLPKPEAKIVKLAQIERGPLIERPLPKPDTEGGEDYSAFVLEFARPTAATPEETPADRFRRALDIEARDTAGQPVGHAERDWLNTYQGLPEYRSQRRVFDEWGDSALG